MQHQVPPQAAIMHMIASYWLSRAVYLAARLKLADVVSDGTATLSTIAAATATKPERLSRLMRALCSHGIFREEADGTFVQTPLSEALKSGPGGMRAIAEAELGHDHYESWREIESCLREGGTAFEHIYGMPVWRYYAQHPQMEALFGEAMSNLTAIANAGVLGGYEFKPFKTAVDVGGGQGSFLGAILDRHPQAEGILFDVPTVIAAAADNAFVARHNGRIKTASGDFFREVPSGADLYLLKFILHDWDDERSIAILKNVRAAISPEGRLAVVEIVLPKSNEPHLGPLIDLNMMVMTGGAERTEAEYAGLLEKSGFRLERVVATKSPFSVVEAVPN